MMKSLAKQCSSAPQGFPSGGGWAKALTPNLAAYKKLAQSFPTFSIKVTIVLNKERAR